MSENTPPEGSPEQPPPNEKVALTGRLTAMTKMAGELSALTGVYATAVAGEVSALPRSNQGMPPGETPLLEVFEQHPPSSDGSAVVHPTSETTEPIPPFPPKPVVAEAGSFAPTGQPALRGAQVTTLGESLPWQGDDRTADQIAYGAEVARRAADMSSGTVTPPLPPAASTHEPPSPRVFPVEVAIRTEVNAAVGAGVQDGGVSSPPAVTTQVIERRLLERPDDIRAAARGFAEAFKKQFDELRGHNERSPQDEDLLDFLEQMAAGLAELADALDRAFASPTPEPIFIGEAGQIVHRLQLETAAWLEKIGTDVVNVPVRVGLLVGSGIFLHSLGVDSEALYGALGFAVLGSPGKLPKQ
jgi:hypothetical protein